MENITDPSFNTEEVIPVAKPSGAAQPMVVVQYRARGVPWWLLSLLTVFAPVCAILIYHSLVVGRYRAQAVETAEAPRTKLDGARPAEVKKAPEAALPLALNSQPIVEPGPPGSLTGSSSAAASASRDQGGSMASAISPAGPAKPDAGPAGVEALKRRKPRGRPHRGAIDPRLRLALMWRPRQLRGRPQAPAVCLRLPAPRLWRRGRQRSPQPRDRNRAPIGRHPIPRRPRRQPCNLSSVVRTACPRSIAVPSTTRARKRSR